jgi:hypothetical protein
MCLFTGCSTLGKWYEHELRKRAAFDFKCSQDHLKITEINDRTSEVVKKTNSKQHFLIQIVSSS